VYFWNKKYIGMYTGTVRRKILPKYGTAGWLVPQPSQPVFDVAPWLDPLYAQRPVMQQAQSRFDAMQQSVNALPDVPPLYNDRSGGNLTGNEDPSGSDGALSPLTGHGYGYAYAYDMPSKLQQAGMFARNIGGFGQLYGDAADRYADDPQAQIRAERAAGLGKTMSTVGAVAAGVGALATGARHFMSGFAAQNMNQHLVRSEAEQQRRRMEGAYMPFADGGRLDRNPAMTGEYMQGLPPQMAHLAGAELERGEYLQTPDGSVREVAGERHEQGGTPVDAQGFVISDRLRIGAERAKRFRQDFGISVKATDTFAGVLDRYKSRSGLKKAYEEQEEYLRRLDRNRTDTPDRATSDLNRLYLTGKIQASQQQIDELTPDFEQFTQLVYEMQEEAKNTENEAYFFGSGGLVRPEIFNRLIREHGLSREEGKKIILQSGGALKQYPGGGQVDGKIRFTPVFNPYIAGNPVAQHRNKAGFYGSVNNEADFKNRMEEQVALMPGLLTKGFLIRNGKGDIVLARGKQWRDVQEYQQKVYSALSRVREIENTKERDAFITRNQYLGDSSVRSVDNRPGDFSTARPAAMLSVVSPDEKQMLQNLGISNHVQLFDENGKWKENVRLSDASRSRIEQIADGNPDIDYLIGAVSVPALESPVPKVQKPDLSMGDLAKYRTAPERPNPAGAKQPLTGSGGFSAADRTELPPYALQLPALRQVALNRIHPAMVSTVNPQLAGIEYSMMEPFRDTVDSQRGAVAASVAAQLGEQADRYFASASQQNAHARQQAQAFNAQTGDREQLTNTQLAQNYEQLAQRAMENTYNEWADYFGNASMMNAQRLQDERTYSLLNSMFHNYRLNGNGTVGYRGQGAAFAVNPLNMRP
jgi:hypothetical protein